MGFRLGSWVSAVVVVVVLAFASGAQAQEIGLLGCERSGSGTRVDFVDLGGNGANPENPRTDIAVANLLLLSCAEALTRLMQAGFSDTFLDVLPAQTSSSDLLVFRLNRP